MAAAEIRINWQVHCANKLHSHPDVGFGVGSGGICSGLLWIGLGSTAAVPGGQMQTHTPIKQVPGLLPLLMQM